MSWLPFDSVMVKSPDGTLIAGRKTGDGPGIPLLVANAVGANLAVWESTIAELSEERPVITWDLRGTFESGLPATGVTASDHTMDALAVIKEFGIERFHLAAWSSGGRVALQIAGDHPERVVSLSMICAGYGHSLGALTRLEFAAVLPRLASIARVASGPIHGVLRNLVARPEVAGLVRQSGLIGGSADTGAFVEYLKGLASIDPRLLFQTYHAVSGDAAPTLLREVIAPTLVIAGESDQFTSKTVTTEMLAKIPDARLEVYEDSTHYLPLEHPGKLAYDLGRFFKEIENSIT